MTTDMFPQNGGIPPDIYSYAEAAQRIQAAGRAKSDRVHRGKTTRRARNKTARNSKRQNRNRR